jgi:hypothetical protein
LAPASTKKPEPYEDAGLPASLVNLRPTPVNVLIAHAGSHF